LGPLVKIQRSIWKLQISTALKSGKTCFDYTPHSNTDAERVFSMINKNKVKTRADLTLEGTLPTIVTCKVNQFFEEPYYEFKPSKEMLQKANKSTWVYNKAYTN